MAAKPPGSSGVFVNDQRLKRLTDIEPNRFDAIDSCAIFPSMETRQKRSGISSAYLEALLIADRRSGLWVGCRVLAISLVCLLFGLPPVRATTVVPPEFSQLVNESDYIVRAVVKSVASEWREDQGHRHIFTFVELDVREVLAGSPPQPLILQMLGGRVGDEELTVSGAPKFAVGDEDVLFIQGNGKNISPLFAIMHGRYPVMKEKGTGREFVARSNRVPLQDTAEVAMPMAEGAAAEIQLRMKNTAQGMTPVQFSQRIKAAVDPTYRRSRPRLP